MTQQLSLFESPPAEGVSYAVVCRLTGDVVEEVREDGDS